MQTVLDLLEVEIRVRYWPDVIKKDMNLMMQDGIESEIAALDKELSCLVVGP